MATIFLLAGVLQQRFEMEPIDKTAIVGDTVILPCRVENKVGTLQCKYIPPWW